MKVFGIDFAPLNIPFQRRIQTFATLVAVVLFLFGHSVGLAMTICGLLFPPLTVPILFYLVWIYFFDSQCPRRGGRRIEFFRNWSFWRYFSDYFPCKVIKTCQLDPSRNYLFAYHPHGLISLGFQVTFVANGNDFQEQFPGIIVHPLTLSLVFRFPFIRDFLLSVGVCDVSRDSCQYILEKMGPGHSIGIVIGGAAEALDAHPGYSRLKLKNRRGFIRIALKSGADLVPMYCFGENDLYDQASNPPGSWLRNFQIRFMRATTFIPPLFHGRGVFNYSFGLLPYRKPLNVVVGKPIRVEKVENPTEEQVAELHQIYISSLKELFTQYRKEYSTNEVEEISLI
ncbi:2-acylglycerol O-acyltransferase 1 [Trichoplax sp. H2]|nr:2-acylglycerol O-acyltransferase 1 [Trichoplax sp. H2]|eukprot:RDD46660.1 2-acylglycerol O-acyltransferase 1 [Trichoplax sp. H2]